MNKKDLLKFCRYYKGQEDNPYKGKNEEWLFKYERHWCELMMKDDEIISDFVNDYINAGLAHFSETDNVPITLKAIMFNRYAQHNEMFTIDEFKDWYKNYSH